MAARKGGLGKGFEALMQSNTMDDELGEKAALHKSEGSGGANEAAADDRCFSWVDGLSHMGYLLYLQNGVGLVTVQ